jgi:hypothetical protein
MERVEKTYGKTPKWDEQYRPIYEEMLGRVNDELTPPRDNPTITKITNSLGTLNFMYYMSSVASALTNMSGIAIFGVPVLESNFGVKATAKALATNMNVFKAVGVHDKDGKFTFPTLISRLSGHRREAYLEGLRREKITATQAYDALNVAKVPSTGRMAGAPSVDEVVGYMFHHSEKLTREVMFMTAYDLAYAQAINRGVPQKAAQEEAVNKAGELSDEALFDYSEFNRPKFMRGGVARTILQFKFFAFQTLSYLARNFTTMLNFKGVSPEVRKQARHKFLGTLGMTWLFAGALGLPGMSALFFPVMSMFLKGEDEEDPEDRDPKLWFSKWLRETFGNTAGQILDRGPITWATNVDFHNRVKLDGLLLRDLKAGLSETDWLREFIVTALGPTVGLGVNVARAKEMIDNGDTSRGMELLLPAGVRSFVSAARVSKEGVRTLKGDEIVPRDQLSDFDLWVIRAGFNPTQVARMRELSSKRQEFMQLLGQRHGKVFNLFKRAMREEDTDKQQALFEEAGEELAAYNEANPFKAIKVKDILGSIKKEMEASALAVDGVRVPKNMIPVIRGIGTDE